MKAKKPGAAAIPVRTFRQCLRRLEREVGISMTSESGCCGVSLAQCHLLLEVEERGKTSITGLAASLELDKSTLSRTVDIACKAGLLLRETEPQNRRRQVITLTAAGRRKVDLINSLCDAAYTRLFDFIPRSRRAAVVDAVAVLADAMRLKRKDPDAACCAD